MKNYNKPDVTFIKVENLSSIEDTRRERYYSGAWKMSALTYMEFF
jgi:hypothetical protein